MLVSGTAYRLAIAADRITLKAKGKRKDDIDITWDELLTWRVHDVETPPVTRASSHRPRSVLTGVAQDLREAAVSLAKADASLVQAGALPAELRTEAAGDPVYGRAEQASDWFIEPLLTVREVASVLRISTRAAKHLALRSIVLAGEVRYRQPEMSGVSVIPSIDRLCGRGQRGHDVCARLSRVWMVKRSR